MFAIVKFYWNGYLQIFSYFYNIQCKIIFLIHVIDEVDSSSIHCTFPGIPIDANRDDAPWNWEKMVCKEVIRDGASAYVKTNHAGWQPPWWGECRMPWNNRISKWRILWWTFSHEVMKFSHSVSSRYFHCYLENCRRCWSKRCLSF